MKSIVAVTLLVLLACVLVSAKRHARDALSSAVDSSLVDLSTIKVSFVQFMQTYDRAYSNEELKTRLAIFTENYNFITSHNARYAAGQESYDVQINKFADWSREEMKAYLTASPKAGKGGLGLGPDIHTEAQKYIAPEALPTSVDWRNTGMLTPVKDQGQCGSCWTFSATGSMEGAWTLKYGNKSLVSLSEQEFVDCVNGGGGCGGGWPRWVFQYVIDHGGADSEASYPYTAQDGKCQFNKTATVAHMKSYVNLTMGDELALTTASSLQPGVSVCIDASKSGFSFYKSGVYKDSTCLKGEDDLDHAVLVAGYGTDSASGLDYYWVKNSWGVNWGDNGYIKMFRDTQGSTNNCGIATVAAYPIAA